LRDLADWQEVGEGVFRRRYQSLNLNVGVVLGADGVLVVDTRASHREAKELRDHLGAVTDLPVQWVVNTHWHWDHTFGNAVFPVEIWGHTRCRARLMSEGEAARVEARSWMPPDRRDELDEVVITPPTNTFSKAKSLDLGGREIRLSFLGLGHTDNDIVVAIPDAGVVFAGDLVEEGSPPYFGDSYPLSWPAALGRLGRSMPTVVVPGHGKAVDRRYVAEQAEMIRRVSEVARSGHQKGVSWERLVAKGPYPEATMATALQRAYLQLSAT